MTWFTEADVEAAARAMALADCEDYMEDYALYDKRCRAALSAIPDPRAAPNRLADVNASGIIDEVCGEWAIETPQGFATALWGRLLDAIAAIPDRYDAGWLDLEERLWRVIDRDGLANGPSNIIAAVAALVGSRAAGFIAARDEIYTETARMWPEAVDLLDYIAALKPEDKP